MGVLLVLDYEGRVGAPAERDVVAWLVRPGARVGVLDVQGDRAGRRLDDVLGRDADVGALLDHAREACFRRPRRAASSPAGSRRPPARCAPAAGARTTVPSPSRTASVAVGLAAQEVRDAEEPGDECCFGVLVELGRGPELLDPARVHDRDRVGHRHRLFLVVRDVDEGDPDLALDPLESSCICLRSFRSRAPSGSSSRSTRGLLTSARARATRCCWPPESCRGLRFSKPPSCTSSSDFPTRRLESRRP